MKKPETIKITNPPKAAWPCNHGEDCPVCGYKKGTEQEDPRWHEFMKKIVEITEEENEKT